MKILYLGILCLLLSVMSLAEARSIYLRSVVGQPWEESTNEAAMDRVFGPGNWEDLQYETVDTATLFSPDTTFIFMEGGDNNAEELEAFLTTNSSNLEEWVANGGSLLLNAAPNEGDGMSFGFGVSLNYPVFDGCDSASAVDPAHPIFNGPLTPVGTSFTGTSFCHATVSGAGITSLVDNGVGNSTLAELDFSLGRALFGGMTTDIFHSPQPEAANLRANIIAFAAREVTRCTLNLEARSTDGTLNLDFEVGTSEPAVLNVWLTAQAEMARLLSASFPVIEAPIPVAVSVPAFPPQGTIGILTTLTTPDAGITCSVFATVNTGPVAAVPEVSAVGIRDQLLQHGTESPDLLCSSSSAGGELECSLQPLKSKERLAPRTRNSRDSMSNSGSDSSQSRSQ